MTHNDADSRSQNVKWYLMVGRHESLVNSNCKINSLLESNSYQVVTLTGARVIIGRIVKML